MNKLVAVVSASLFLSGLVANQAMALSGFFQSGGVSTPLSNMQKQPQIFSDGLVIQASVGCVVNWVNGACGSPEFLRNNIGVSKAPNPPVVVPPVIVVIPTDPCPGLRLTAECD